MKTDHIAKLTPEFLPLSKVDTRPGPCCMSFGFDLKPLIQSIERVGLINTPLLLRNKKGVLKVITGYKRILAHHEMKLDRVGCRIVTTADLSPLECLLINLYDNLTVRALNPVEKGMVLAHLDSLVSTDDMLTHYMPLLGLPSHEETRQLYIAIHREFDETTRRLVAGERLGIPGLKAILELDADARGAISTLLTNLKLNINQQIQLIEYLYDLSHIEHRSVADILNDDPFMDILSDAHTNAPQKGKALLRLLRQRRLPSVVQADRVFKRQVAGLSLPKGVQIAAPPYFEGPHFKLTIQFKDGVELVKRIKELNTIEGLNALIFPWKKTP